MRVRRSLPVLGLFLLGCSLAHERGAPDAGEVSDAATPTDTAPAQDDAVVDPNPCASGRQEVVLDAPAARRSGFYVLLMQPRVSASGARVAANAEVVSRTQGGIGSSDVLTYDASGGAPRAFFTTELPYVLGTTGGLEEYLAGGGFAAGRVFGEIRRFANDRFEVVRSDDTTPSPTDAPIDVALPPGVPTFSLFDIAQEGERAVRFDDHRGVVVYAVAGDVITEARVVHPPDGIALLGPSPRISPSGRMAVFRSGTDARILTALDTETGASQTHVVPSEVGAIALLDDTRVLVLPRRADDAAHPMLWVVSLVGDPATPLDLGLPSEPPDTSHLTDAIDVSPNAQTFVLTEEGGRHLRVVRCDPALLALAR